MRRYEEIEKPQRYLIAVEVKCDRCGKSAKVAGAGQDRAAWGELSILEQGGDDEIRMDLCRKCSGEMVEWISKSGGKIRRISDAIKEMDLRR